jgi:rod shape-determining protein MreC
LFYNEKIQAQNNSNAKTMLKLKRKMKRKQIIWLIIFLTFFLMIALLGENLRSAFFKTTDKLQQSFWEQGKKFLSLFSEFALNQNLKKENEALKEENQHLLSEITELKGLKKENRKLREALSLGIGKEFKILDAFIIARSIDKDSFFINRGKKEGVEEGLIVITPQKAFIGKVKKVYEKNSLVTLITSPKMKFNIEIGKDALIGVAEGRGNLRLEAENIPKDKEIKEGDIVLTGKLQKDLPGGLLVGKVKKIEKNDLSPFQNIEISPFFDFQEVDLVFIIIDF